MTPCVQVHAQADGDSSSSGDGSGGGSGRLLEAAAYYRASIEANEEAAATLLALDEARDQDRSGSGSTTYIYNNSNM